MGPMISVLSSRCTLHLEGSSQCMATLENPVETLEPFLPVQTKETPHWFWKFFQKKAEPIALEVKLRYTEIEEIHSDENCRIIKVRNSMNSGEFVLKVPLNQSREKEIRNEIEILNLLNGGTSPEKDSIIEKVNSFVVKETPFLLLPCYPFNLREFIREKRSVYQETSSSFLKELVLPVFKQLLDGALYLKECEVMHLDIKPQNVVIDESKKIKIIDFGISRRKSEGGTKAGTRAYKSPERLKSGKNCDYPSDMWSIGCTVGELMGFGTVLFPSSTSKETQKKQLDFFEKKQEEICSFKDFFRNLLRKEPDQDLVDATIEILAKTFEFDPNKRISPESALELFKALPFQQFDCNEKRSPVTSNLL